MRTELAPGPWLRLSALVAAGGTLLAVVSGAEGLGTAHRLLAALVAPPLAALVVSAWYAHRRLVPAVLAAARCSPLLPRFPGRMRTPGSPPSRWRRSWSWWPRASAASAFRGVPGATTWR